MPRKTDPCITFLGRSTYHNWFQLISELCINISNSTGRSAISSLITSPIKVFYRVKLSIEVST